MMNYTVTQNAKVSGSRQIARAFLKSATNWCCCALALEVVLLLNASEASSGMFSQYQVNDLVVALRNHSPDGSVCRAHNKHRSGYGTGIAMCQSDSPNSKFYLEAATGGILLDIQFDQIAYARKLPSDPIEIQISTDMGYVIPLFNDYGISIANAGLCAQQALDDYVARIESHYTSPSHSFVFRAGQFELKCQANVSGLFMGLGIGVSPEN
ncbi:hypothetical protein [Mesorhizobium sp. M0199]|uniref:hypothetical protein n=1 Tax=Mesorhizobium sp. M0199 TaxID=2956911 RepID=UPI0033378584